MLTTKTIFPKLKEDLNKAEEERLAAIRRSKPWLYLFYGFIGLYVVLVIAFPQAWAAGLLALPVAIIPWVIKRKRETDKLNKIIQKTVFPKVINEMGPGFSYDADGQMDKETINKSRLFDYYNILNCEDLITGKVEEKTFRYAELELKSRSQSVNNSSSTNKTRVVFKGIFFVLDLSKEVPSPFYVYPALIAGFLEKLSKSFLPGKRILFDNEAFNKVYRVYTEDPDTIKQLLPDAMLDKLVSINQQLKDDGITKTFTRFSFVGKNVFVAIEASKGLMNPSLGTPLNTEAFIEPQILLINRMNELAQII